MTETWAHVVGVAVLLVITVLSEPVAKRLRIPHSVLLAGLGAAAGYAVAFLLPAMPERAVEDLPHWRQAVGAVTGLTLTADIIFFLFLPALVFESALVLDLRRLRQDLPVITFLAVVGVLISTFAVGVALNAVSDLSLIVCLLIGGIIAATDPVAVIALFKDLGAPKRLTVLVEGESLFNDATAIVVAGIFLGLLSQHGEVAFGAAVIDFARVFVFGVVVGSIIARLTIAMMTPFLRKPLSVVSLAIVMPFLAFVTAEHFFHVSGVMAAVTCGLSLGNYGRRVLPPAVFEDIRHLWEQIAYWATGLIFLLVGLAVPTLIGTDPLDYLDEAAIVFVVATVIRFLVIFGAMPLLSRAGLAEKLSRGFQVVMVWGGLRGAVSLALALLVLDTEALAPGTKAAIGELVTIFVLSTLLLQATTIGGIMKLLGLRGLTAEDRLVRDRSLSFVRTQVAEELTGQLDARGQDREPFEDLLDRYRGVIARTPAAITGPVAPWARTGMLLALTQERQFYLEAYEEGAISANKRGIILSRIDDVMDNLRSVVCEGDDLAALKAVVERSVTHTKAFERALALYRLTRITTPMANSLTLRFNGLTAIRAALARQAREGLSEITAILPETAQPAFRELYELRAQSIERAYAAFLRQHPQFALAVDRYNFRRAGLRLERRGLERLRDSGLIGPQIFQNLISKLNDEEEPRPRLELHFDKVELLRRLPLFNRADRKTQRHLASRLKDVFLLPGDTLFEVGAPGDGMYFVADGAITLNMATGEIIELGTGDFFGEVALLTGKPRVATAVSDAYSTLLRLSRPDFEKVMASAPDLAAEIEAVAHERHDFAEAELLRL